MQLFKQNNFINSTYNLWVDQKPGVQQQLAQIQIRIQVIEIWTMEKIKFIGIWIIFSFFFLIRLINVQSLSYQITHSDEQFN